MRNLDILFIISIQIIFSLGAAGQSTYFKILDCSSNAGVFDVLEIPDGKFILTGIIDSTGTQSASCGYLIKLNEYGEIINEVVQCSQNSFVQFSCVRNIPGTLSEKILYGDIDSTLTDENNSGRVFICRVNDDLEISNQNYSSSIPDSLVSSGNIIVNNDSTAFLFGMKFSTMTSKSCLWRGKSNYPYSSFEIRNIPDSKTRLPQAMLSNPHDSLLNEFIYGGAVDDRSFPVNIVQFDTSLQFLGSIPLPDLFRVQVSACHYTDTTYLVTATSTLPECRGIIIGEFDYRTHDTLRTFRYRFSPDTILYNCLGSTVVNGNGIFITGVYNLIPSQFPYQQSPMWIVITKLDHQFNVVSHHFYGGDAAYYSYKSIETSDGGLLSVGRRWDNSAYPQLNTDPFALKVNSDGMVVSAGSPDDERISEAILFPNPANDKVNIIMGNQVKHATVVFCNASGQIILQDNLDQPVNTRDVSSYPPGMYLYKIFSGKKMIGSGKWIKQ